jgi:hypothetical protein
VEKSGARDRSSRVWQEEWSQERKSVATAWGRVERMTGARESDRQVMSLVTKGDIIV